jgi:hypothetical protein
MWLLLKTWAVMFGISRLCGEMILILITAACPDLQIALSSVKTIATWHLINTRFKMGKLTIYLKKRVGRVRYRVACPDCMTSYDASDVFNDKTGVVLNCQRTNFPHHMRPSMRGTCGGILGVSHRSRRKSVNAPRFLFKPKNIQPDVSIVASLQRMLLRTGLCESLLSWRKRSSKMPTGYMADIYDADAWKNPFFHRTDCLPIAFSLNIDWFQAFDRSLHSIGAIYLVCLNLPRSQRYLRHNVILLKLLPYGHQSELNMDNILRDAVTELKSMWHGVKMSSPSGPIMVS